MVTIDEVITFQRKDGIIESEAVITAKDQDSVASGDLDLATISRVKSVQPLADGNIAGAAVIDHPDSLNNSVTLTLYSLPAAGDSLVPAGSVDWMINAQQV